MRPLSFLSLALTMAVLCPQQEPEPEPEPEPPPPLPRYKRGSSDTYYTSDPNPVYGCRYCHRNDGAHNSRCPERDRHG